MGSPVVVDHDPFAAGPTPDKATGPVVVDHDPFAVAAHPTVRPVVVDHDPFATPHPAAPAIHPTQTRYVDSDGRNVVEINQQADQPPPKPAPAPPPAFKKGPSRIARLGTEAKRGFLEGGVELTDTAHTAESLNTHLLDPTGTQARWSKNNGGMKRGQWFNFNPKPGEPWLSLKPIDDWVDDEAKAGSAWLKSMMPKESPKAKDWVDSTIDVAGGVGGGLIPGAVEWTAGLPFAAVHGIKSARDLAAQQGRKPTDAEIAWDTIVEVGGRHFLGKFLHGPNSPINKGIVNAAGMGAQHMSEVAASKVAGGKPVMPTEQEVRQEIVGFGVNFLVGAIGGKLSKAERVTIDEARAKAARGDSQGAIRELNDILGRHKEAIAKAARNWRPPEDVAKPPVRPTKAKPPRPPKPHEGDDPTKVPTDPTKHAAKVRPRGEGGRFKKKEATPATPKGETAAPPPGPLEPASEPLAAKDTLNQPPPAPAQAEAPVTPQEVQGVPDLTDKALETIRSGRKPVFGRGLSLAEFLARKGGLRDEGGELSRLDAHLWHRQKPVEGQRAARGKLVTDQGMTLAHAAELAWQEGYIASDAEGIGGGQPTENALIAALEREMAGKPVWKEEDKNAALRDHMKDVQDAIDSLGLDIKTMSNEEIKARIKEAFDVETPSKAEQDHIIEGATFDKADYAHRDAFDDLPPEATDPALLSALEQLFTQHPGLFLQADDSRLGLPPEVVSALERAGHDLVGSHTLDDLRGLAADRASGRRMFPTTTERVRLANGDTEQGVMPGMERSAKQAAAARGDTLKAKGPQAEPGGLFATPEAEEPRLFDGFDTAFQAGDGTVVHDDEIDYYHLTPRERRLKADIIKEVNDLLQRIAPMAKVGLYRKLRTNKDFQIHGAASIDAEAMEAIVIISLESDDPYGTARHEAVHILKRMGFLNPAEWEALRSEAIKQNWIKKYNIDKRYPKDTYEVRLEEAVAEHFAQWRRGKADGPIKQQILEAYYRIAEFLDQVGRVIRGMINDFNGNLGFGVELLTANDVLHLMRSGRVGERPPVDPKTGTRMQRADLDHEVDEAVAKLHERLLAGAGKDDPTVRMLTDRIRNRALAADLDFDAQIAREAEKLHTAADDRYRAPWNETGEYSDGRHPGVPGSTFDSAYDRVYKRLSDMVAQGRIPDRFIHDYALEPIDGAPDKPAGLAAGPGTDASGARSTPPRARRRPPQKPDPKQGRFAFRVSEEAGEFDREEDGSGDDGSGDGRPPRLTTPAPGGKGNRQALDTAKASLAVRMAHLDRERGVHRKNVADSANLFWGIPDDQRMALVIAYEEGGVDAVRAKQREMWGDDHADHSHDFTGLTLDLAPFFESAEWLFKQQLHDEWAAGLDVPERANYFSHLLRTPEEQAAYIEKFGGAVSDDPLSAGMNRPKGSKLGSGGRKTKAAFMKQRAFQDYREAIEAGFVPVTTNPAEILIARLESGAKAIALHKGAKDMIEDGLALSEPEFNGLEDKRPFAGWKHMTVLGKSYLMHPKAAEIFERAFGMDRQRIFDPTSIMGKTSDVLYKTWMTARAGTIRSALALSAFHALHVMHIQFVQPIAAILSNTGKHMTLKDAAKRFSDMSKVTNAVEGGRVATELFKTPEHEMTDVERARVNLHLAGGNTPGAATLFEQRARQKLQFALRDVIPSLRAEIAANGWSLGRGFRLTGETMKSLGRGFRLTGETMKVIFDLTAAAMHKIEGDTFSEMIPSLKNTAYENEAIMFIEAYPELMDGSLESNNQLRIALNDIRRSIDNRFGQMQYNKEFWPTLAKKAAFATFLSVGWNLGFMREFGAGHTRDLATAGKKIITDKKFELSRRTIYASAYLATAVMLNGMMTYLLTGEPPKDDKDYIWPREANGERVTNMFFTREYGAAAEDTELYGWQAPIRFGAAKFNALAGTLPAAFTNQDFYGSQIRDPNAPVWDQVGQTLAHFSQVTMLPISIQGMTAHPGMTPDEMALSMAGFGPAPGYTRHTHAQTSILRAFNEQHPSHVVAYNEVQQMTLKSEIKRLHEKFLRTGDTEMEAQMNEKIAEYEQRFPQKNVNFERLEQTWEEPPYAELLKQIDPTTQVRLYKSMSQEEKEMYGPFIGREARDKLEAEGVGVY